MKIKALLLASLLLVGCSSQKSDDHFSYSSIYTEQGYLKNITAANLVQDIDLDQFEITQEMTSITQEELNTALTSFYAYYPVEATKIYDRAVKDGDTLNIDYVGYVDGEAFDNGSTQEKGTSVTIGVTSYIDDFLEQLIGHKPGDSLSVHVTFPDDYSEETLQGKDAVFETTINHIEESVYDDAYASANFKELYGWTSISDVEKGVKEQLIASRIKEYIYNTLNEMKLEKDVPETLITYQENMAQTYYQNYADSYGVELEAFIQTYLGYDTLEEMQEKERATYTANAQYSLVSMAIAERENFKIDDETLSSYFLENMGSSDYSEYEATYGLPYLKHIVLSDMALDHLYNTLMK